MCYAADEVLRGRPVRPRKMGALVATVLRETLARCSVAIETIFLSVRWISGCGFSCVCARAIRLWPSRCRCSKYLRFSSRFQIINDAFWIPKCVSVGVEIGIRFIASRHRASSRNSASDSNSHGSGSFSGCLVGRVMRVLCGAGCLGCEGTISY